VGFSKRSTLVQRDGREGLRDIVGEALARTGIPDDAVQLQDRGDGFFGVVSAEVPAAEVVADLPRELRIALGAYNRTRNEAGRLRLRVALHQGQVVVDGTGFAGRASVVAARLVDAPALRRVIDGTPAADLALIVSSDMFDATVRDRLRGLDPGEFREVHLDLPSFTGTAWVNVPGVSTPPRV
jgi:hypothetical protein